MAFSWYVEKQSGPLGPYSSAQLKQLASSGQLRPEDPVRRADQEKVLAAGKIKGLFPENVPQDRQPASPPPQPTADAPYLSSTAQEWYYAVGDKKRGPVSPEQLQVLASSGEMKPTDLVWTEGMSNWRQAGTVNELFPAEASQPEPPPIPASAVQENVPEAHAIFDHDHGDHIDRLPVSETWKRRFRAIEQDPTKFQFNTAAFFFGLFYYGYKGLWKKGLVLTLLGVVVSTLIELVAYGFGWELPGGCLWVPTGAICAMMANRDVYRKEVLGETFWPQLGRIDSPMKIVGVTILVFVTTGVLSAFLSPVPTLPEVDSPEVISLVESALRNSPALKLTGELIGPVTITDPGEVSYDPKKPKRVARAILKSNLGQEVIYYTVEWQNRDNGIIWVQTQDHE